MDQLYTTSQVSHITRKTKFLVFVDTFPRLNKKSVKTEKNRTQNCTCYTGRQALYFKIITIIPNFVGPIKLLSLVRSEYSCTESVLILRCHLLY